MLLDIDADYRGRSSAQPSSEILEDTSQYMTAKLAYAEIEKHEQPPPPATTTSKKASLVQNYSFGE